MPRISPESVVARVVTSETSDPAPATEATPPVLEKAEKPFLVYVADPATAGDTFDKIEKVLFQDERIAFGARGFTPVRMSPEEQAADPLLAKQGSTLPRFLVVTADYKKVTVVERTVTGSSVWAAMQTAIDKFYDKALDARVREQKDIVLEYDKIAGEKKTLEDKKTRMTEKASEAEMKAIEAKLAALETRQQKARDREVAIWTLKPKAA